MISDENKNNVISALIKNLTDRRNKLISDYCFTRNKQLTELLLLITKWKKARKRKKPQKIWVKERSSTFWEKDVWENDDNFFKENFRVSREAFNRLCDELRSLGKQNTNYRKCIPLEKRVAIGLYALGSSSDYQSIADLFGVGKSTVCKILKSFCEEVWNVLQPTYLNLYPLTEQQIYENVRGFEKLGFPQCFGAIDCCHIGIKPPVKDAPAYFNLHGGHSIVLLATVDYRHRFMYINVDSPGRCNDFEIFENSELKAIHQNPILKEKCKNICGVEVPVVLLGSSTIPLSEIVMKEYPNISTATAEQKSFNNALSKCRSVAEVAFRQLKARFKRIDKGLDNHIANTSLIVKSSCVLHNFLSMHNDQINNHWLLEEEDVSFQKQPEHDSCTDENIPAENIRTALSHYISVCGVEVLETELLDVDVDAAES